MRFHQLQHNARFKFKGSVYRKISPLKGLNEADGVQKLVPRSAEVTPIDEHGRTVATGLPERLDSRLVDAELARFLAACDLAAQRLDPALTGVQLAQLQRALGEARQDLLTRLALGDR